MYISNAKILNRGIYILLKIIILLLILLNYRTLVVSNILKALKTKISIIFAGDRLFLITTVHNKI